MSSPLPISRFIWLSRLDLKLIEIFGIIVGGRFIVILLPSFFSHILYITTRWNSSLLKVIRIYLRTPLRMYHYQEAWPGRPTPGQTCFSRPHLPGCCFQFLAKAHSLSSRNRYFSGHWRACSASGNQSFIKIRSKWSMICLHTVCALNIYTQSQFHMEGPLTFDSSNRIPSLIKQTKPFF